LPTHSTIDSSLNEYVKLLTGKNKKILQLGFESLQITQNFEEQNCSVTQIKIADNFEKLNLNEELKHKKFDVILIKDILERQKNPELFLKNLKSFIAENGFIVCIVPNFTHGSVRLKLLDGDFQYQKLGVLDRANIRFYSLDEILILLNKSGYQITNLNRIKKNITDIDDFSLKLYTIPLELINSILRDPESTTYQYVFSMTPSNEFNYNIDWITEFSKNYVTNDLKNRIDDLQKTVLYKDTKIESLQKTVLYKDTKIESLQKLTSDKDIEIESLQTAVENSQKIIIDIHQSFVLRMLHKYDRTIGKIIPLRPKKYVKSVKHQLTITEQETHTKKALENIMEKKDIICFPIINWDFRYQRPQHILSEFAKKGHRVFYLTVNLRQLTKPYEIKPLANNIYQIELGSPKFFDIYKDKFNDSLVSNLINQIKELDKDLKLDAILFVEFPTWAPLVLELKTQFDYPIVFDCLDDFTSFGNVIKEREKEESFLISSSDLVLATSSYLLKKVMNKTKKSLFLPNAGEFGHFNKAENGFLKFKKPIIGYFGSISDWFDTDLIEYLATKRPKFTFVMIGHTFGADIRKFQELPNVHFLGERPYSELPKHLHDFDVCLIPFKMIPLIEATHPVKIYEYFAAGKPVVATNMVELHPMSDMCYLAENNEDFLKKLDLAINEKDDAIVQKRMKFASENTWENRFKTLYAELKKMDSFDMENHS
jgi:glycosyltransferase involved in cell wall biosynthesis